MRNLIFFALLAFCSGAFATDCDQALLKTRFQNTALAEIWTRAVELEERIQGYIAKLEKLPQTQRRDAWVEELRAKQRAAGRLIANLKTDDPLSTPSRRYKVRLASLNEEVSDVLDKIGDIPVITEPQRAPAPAPAAAKTFRADDYVRPATEGWGRSPGYMKP